MRYKIVSDESSHKYYIPAERAEDWEVFIESGTYVLPEWAERIDGRFTFTDPRCK